MKKLVVAAWLLITSNVFAQTNLDTVTVTATLRQASTIGRDITGIRSVAYGNLPVRWTSANLFGIPISSILTSLFTDRATLKLGEIFDVVFRTKKDIQPGDKRHDKIEKGSLVISMITPDAFEVGGKNTISVRGEKP